MSSTMVQIVCGILAVVLVAVVIMRRKGKKKEEEDKQAAAEAAEADRQKAEAEAAAEKQKQDEILAKIRESLAAASDDSKTLSTGPSGVKSNDGDFSLEP